MGHGTDVDPFNPSNQAVATRRSPGLHRLETTAELVPPCSPPVDYSLSLFPSPSPASIETSLALNPGNLRMATSDFRVLLLCGAPTAAPLFDPGIRSKSGSAWVPYPPANHQSPSSANPRNKHHSAARRWDNHVQSQHDERGAVIRDRTTTFIEQSEEPVGGGSRWKY